MVYINYQLSFGMIHSWKQWQSTVAFIIFYIVLLSESSCIDSVWCIWRFCTALHATSEQHYSQKASSTSSCTVSGKYESFTIMLLPPPKKKKWVGCTHYPPLFPHRKMYRGFNIFRKSECHIHGCCSAASTKEGSGLHYFDLPDD